MSDVLTTPRSPGPPSNEVQRHDATTEPALTNASQTKPVKPDPDCTRVPQPTDGDRRQTPPKPRLPIGAPPPTRRRIRPVPPGPAITFVPLPETCFDDEPAHGSLDGRELDDWAVDDWDRRADALQWWMADLGGPHPVSVETSRSDADTCRSLERSLRRFGVDVIEANAARIKGLLPAPPERAAIRLARWLMRRQRVRLEVIEVRIEHDEVGCRVNARAGGERAAEALRIALSELPPARR